MAPTKQQKFLKKAEKDCNFFQKFLLFGGRHLENFVPTGKAGISIKTRSI
jgi:hypothetical protein